VTTVQAGAAVVQVNADAVQNEPDETFTVTISNPVAATIDAGHATATGTIKDNTGAVKINGKPDISKLYDDNGQWFVENVVGSPKP